MKILPKYLVRLHVVPFVFTLTALTSLLLLNQIAKRFGSLVGKGLHWSVMVEFFALTIPFLMAMTIPMAVLVTVLYTFSKLAADQEITALKGAGVSTAQIMRPVLGAAVLVALGSFIIGDQVVPRTNHRLRTLMTDIDRTKPVFVLREQVINEVQRNKVFLRSAQIDAAAHRLHDVTIWDISNDGRKRIIYADSGEMAFDERQVDLYMTLFDGVVREINRTEPDVFEQIEFQTNIIQVPDVGSELARTISDNFRGDREKGVCALGNDVRVARREETITARQLRATRDNLLRELVGLARLRPDTTTENRSAGVYCDRIEPLLTSVLPTPLSAQEPPTNQARAPRQRLQDRPVRTTFRAARVPVIPTGEVRALETRYRQARTRAARNLIEMHKKYALSVACIVFALIGVPVALKFPRGGVDLVIGVSITVFGIYYVGLIAGEAAGDRLALPPQLAMWLANILFTAVGLVLFYRMALETTPRSMRRSLFKRRKRHPA